MGRQIEFYMNHSVDKAFLDYLQESNYIFYYYDRHKNIIRTCVAEETSYRMYLCRKPYESMAYYATDERAIDIFKSAVIQLSRTIIDDSQKQITKGRIWIPTNIYDSSGNSLSIPDEMRLDYNRLVRWIKKHVPYIYLSKRDSVTDKEYQMRYYVNEDLAALSECGYVFK